MEDADEPLDAMSVDDGGEAETGRGLALAYRFLNRRERSVSEVRERLERAEIPGDEIESVISELLEYGYLDDTRYARVFAEDKRTLDQWGADRIARTLRERGIDRALIEATLAASGDGEDESELDRALGFLQQRFPAGPADQRDRERAFGMLARKGYESEVAGDAIRVWARG